MMITMSSRIADTYAEHTQRQDAGGTDPPLAQFIITLIRLPSFSSVERCSSAALSAGRRRARRPSPAAANN